MFSKSFFSVFFIVTEWDKLDPNIRNISSVAVFKSNMLKFMNQSKIIVLIVSNLKYMNGLCLSLSHMGNQLSRTIESNF